jgi:type III secretion protein L
MDLVVLVDQPDFTVTSASRVIKRHDVATVLQAAEVLQRAQEHGQLMREKSLQGYEQERTSGYNQGLLQAQEEWAQRLAVAQSARYLALKDLAPTLVDIVVDGVSVILKNADRQQLMASAMSSVADLIKQARWARLRVHPQQADDARSMLDTFAQQSGTSLDWVSVIEDASLALDACVFETDIGIADASLSVQLAAIRRAVESAVAQMVESVPAEQP